MISNVLSVIVGISSFVYTCYILCRLTYFLSSNGDNENLHTVLGMFLLNYINWAIFY